MKRIFKPGISLLALASLTLMQGACGRSQTPSIDPASLTGRLVFIGQTHAAGKLYPTDVRAYRLRLGKPGEVPVALTPASRHVWHLAWNEAKSVMYYTAFDGKSDAWFQMDSLDEINEALVSPRAMDLSGFPTMFAFSRDGRYTAGVLRLSGWNHLWVKDLSGSAPPLEISGQTTWDFIAPTWSPDDSQIIFAGTLGGDINYTELFSTDRDGTHVRQLTDMPSWVSWWVRIFFPGPKPTRWDKHHTTNPAWSPDGQWVLFTSFRHLYRMRSDGSMLELIAEHAWYPTWSPDGKMIAYATSPDDGPSIDNIYVSYPDGTGAVRVTDNSSPTIYSELHWIK